MDGDDGQEAEEGLRIADQKGVPNQNDFEGNVNEL